MRDCYNNDKPLDVAESREKRKEGRETEVHVVGGKELKATRRRGDTDILSGEACSGGFDRDRSSTPRGATHVE